MRVDPSLRRESDMMAFYLGVALLVALNLPSETATPPPDELLLIVWGVTIGLAVAHWFTLSLAMYLVRDPGVRHSPAEMLFGQVVMAVILSLVASGALLLSPHSVKLAAARVAVALFVGVLVTVEACTGGKGTRRGFALGAIALILAEGVATFKYALK